MLSLLYASAARARREWYARRPERRRRLERPVISVGNIAVGGSGKTPAVAHIAKLLLEAGERPAILTRGYARACPSDGVTVVSDGRRILADLDRAGDEPLMLARQLPDVPVLVSSDRHLAGLLAERKFGCSVHLLDDGFQHFQLERDLDVVLVSADDVQKPLTLPWGRLREPVDVLRHASAVIVAGADADQAEAARAEASQVSRAASRTALGQASPGPSEVDGRLAEREGPAVFRLRRQSERPRLIEPAGRVVSPAAGTRVLALAGLARPERFFAELAGEGWTVAAELAFADHHRYTGLDLARIASEMRAARAVMVITTEKDLVRLLPLRPLPVPVAWVPMRVEIEPGAEFRAWLSGRLNDRSRRVVGEERKGERFVEPGLRPQAAGRKPA